MDEKNFKAKRMEDQDLSTVFAQLQIKRGKANVVFKKNLYKKYETKKISEDEISKQKFHTEIDTNSYEVWRKQRQSAESWNAFISKAA
jgi:hypothetical protein